MATLAIIKLLKQLDLNLLHLQHQCDQLSTRLLKLENIMGANLSNPFASSVKPTNDSNSSSCQIVEVIDEYPQPFTAGDQLFANSEIPSIDLTETPNDLSQGETTTLMDNGREAIEFENSDPVEIPSDHEQLEGSQCDTSSLDALPPADEIQAKKQKCSNGWDEEAFKLKVYQYLTSTLGTKSKKLKLTAALERISCMCKELNDCPMQTKNEIQKWITKQPCITITSGRLNGKTIKFLIYNPNIVQ